MEEPTNFKLTVNLVTAGTPLDLALLPAIRARVDEGRRIAAFHVRRDKAARIQRVQAPPGDRSSRKQPGQAWRRRNV